MGREWVGPLQPSRPLGPSSWRGTHGTASRHTIRRMAVDSEMSDDVLRVALTRIKRARAVVLALLLVGAGGLHLLFF
jgi:hypothetical protein